MLSGPTWRPSSGFSRETRPRRPDVKTVTVEIVRPLDAEMKLEADAAVTRAVPTTGSARIDIRV